MNTIKVNLSDASAVLQLGRRGENEVSEVIFDYADWVEEFGPGVVSLLVRRSRDASAYPVTLTSGEGNTVTWLVSATDTQYVGGGRAELVYTVDEQIAKSVVYKTSVLQDIGEPSTTPPDPYETWVDTLTALGATVEGYAQDAAESATAAEEAVAHYPKIENDYWYVWDTEADDFVNTGIKAEGEDGFSPTVTIAEIPGGHRVTITDAEGDHTFDVMDGTVNSVNGKTGTVVLDASDVGALPSNTTYVSSVNGSSGAVTVTVPTKTSDLQNDSGFITSAPVTSVNSKTGAVTLTASDVGAGTYSKPSGGIPKTDLASAVQTSLGKADTALQSVPSTYRTAAAQDVIDQAQDTVIAGKLSTTGNAYRAVSIPMGQLDATSTATVMTATVQGITELRDGVCVWLTNGVIASASGCTLNINNLGAKPIYNSLSGTVVTTTFTAASTYLFVYNATRVTGGCWDMVYGYDANTTYTPVKLGFGYATCSTAEATAAKTAALSSYTLTTGGIVSVKFTNAVPAGSTLNINSKGAKAIYYKGAAITAGVIKAGDTVTMIYSTYYHVLSIDRTPLPSDVTPADVNTYGDPGSSNDYARADHMHGFDGAALENELELLDAVNIPVILTNATTGAVSIMVSPDNLAGLFTSQRKCNFALVIPPDTTNFPVLFTASKFSPTTGELHLTGIVDGVLYEAVLTPGGSSTMTGTLTTTNLTLPSAQGVSF